MEVPVVTARYSNKTLRDPEKFVVVRTSLGSPKFEMANPPAYVLSPMMPRFEMLKMERPEYELAYRRMLAGVGVAKFWEELNRLVLANPDKVVALCCYEDIRKPNEWCHRRIFAEWFAEQTGYEIPELPEDLPAKALQLGLL